MSSSQLIQVRTFAASLCFIVALAGRGIAQCPMDDATTTNNDCASATAGTIGVTSGLSVQDLTEDWWTFDVPAGDSITLDVNLLSGNADLDLALFDDSGTCVNLVDNSETTGALESVTYGNATASLVTVTLRVFLFSGICEDYDLTATVTVAPPTPCSLLPDDLEEENDDCLTAVVPSANPLSMLFVSKTDEDWYSFTVNDGGILTVDVLHVTADGDVDAELYAADCLTVLDVSDSSTDNESLTWTNNTGMVATVLARVFIWAGDDLDCNADYSLSSSVALELCLTGMDDAFEENDDCATAMPMAVGLQTGLFVRKEGVDEDWYSIDVMDGDTLNVSCLFLSDDGDIDIRLFDACGGTLLDDAVTNTDDEDVTWTNNTGATVNVQWAVFVWAGDPTEECNVYDMDVEIPGLAPPNLVPYCFGDGSGTACPCGNNSTPGHMGGCGNSQGDGAVLTATGDPSVAMDSLNLDLSMADANSFALLVSAANPLPQVGGCIGCGALAFDGLRCSGGNFFRHGARGTDAVGDVGDGWGPPGGPPGGLIAFNGFTAGQERYFFAFYRDQAMEVCMTGQNSSNGVAVTFLP